MTGDRTRTDSEASAVGILRQQNEPKTQSDAPTVPMKELPMPKYEFQNPPFGSVSSAPLGGMGGGDSQGSSAQEADTQPGASLTVLVPREPTEAMLDAADDAFHAELQKQRAANRRAGRPVDAYGSGPVSEAIWSAMIAATQQATGEGVYLDAAQIKAIERAAMDAGCTAWGKARLGMVRDGRVIGYPCFSRADMAALARLYREDGQQAVCPAEGVASLIKGEGRHE